MLAQLSPIHHTFAPLADVRSCLRALRTLALPHRWLEGPDTAKLETSLGQALQGEAITFGSGREGLLALLRALEVQPGDEVIVQGYTCIVVPNAIRASGAVPVFADIERDTLNLDLEVTAQAITPRTRAIIVQHTFGIPGDLKALRSLCDAHQLALIEDCAHVLPDDGHPPMLGVTGDFTLLSFGRDKAISGVSGGAIVSRHTLLSQRLRAAQAAAAPLPTAEVARLLLYPLIYACARPLYGLWLGKAVLKAASLLRILPRILTDDERGGHASGLVHRLPAACATLALDQWERLPQLNRRRRRLASTLLQEAKRRRLFGTGGSDDPLPRAVHGDLALQKLPLFVQDAQGIRAALRRQNIHLDDGWTSCVICPATVRLDATDYKWGSDPVAEKLCQQILSLPTHPTMTDAQLDRLLDALAPLLPRCQPTEVPTNA
jgi:dTDP-4-amino-4,6-dideoxygalactose transaminase